MTRQTIMPATILTPKITAMISANVQSERLSMTQGEMCSKLELEIGMLVVE
jgi:hypothetical protein